MRSQNSRPKWWLLYLIFPLLIVFFVLEHRLKISTGGHEELQLGIILLVYGLIYWWIKVNARAMSRLDQQYHGKYTVVESPPIQIADSTKENQPMLKFPKSEVRGVLSDTFELDQVSQEANRE